MRCDPLPFCASELHHQQHPSFWTAVPPLEPAPTPPESGSPPACRRTQPTTAHHSDVRRASRRHHPTPHTAFGLLIQRTKDGVMLV